MSFIKRIIITIFNKLLPKNRPVRIISGPLRRFKWYYFSSVPSFYFGHFEIKKVKLFVKDCLNKKNILDIGANTGYYSLLASKYSSDNCRIYAFEPSLRNFDGLNKNIDCNNLKNVKTYQKAITDKNGEVFLKENSIGVLDTVNNLVGDYMVKSISIDSFCEENNIYPDLIKMDIEGAELDALRGALNTLDKYSPIIFLSAHSEELERDCLSLLKKLNYSYYRIEDRDFILKK
jgi:FkbM family methyltransferase